MRRRSQKNTLPDIPLSPEADAFAKRILERIEDRLREVNRVPVGVLLWGPGMSSKSPLAIVRSDLRTALRRDGHAAYFSEEICGRKAATSIRLQQLAQAQEFDLVVSIPCTPGSIGEVHDFAADRRVNARTLVFLNEETLDGYSPQSLAAISTAVSCTLFRYPSERNTSVIKVQTAEEVQRIREMKYILAGRC